MLSGRYAACDTLLQKTSLMRDFLQQRISSVDPKKWKLAHRLIRVRWKRWAWSRMMKVSFWGPTVTRPKNENRDWFEIAHHPYANEYEECDEIKIIIFRVRYRTFFIEKPHHECRFTLWNPIWLGFLFDHSKERVFLPLRERNRGNRRCLEGRSEAPKSCRGLSNPPSLHTAHLSG